MPFKSEAQRRKFGELVKQGKMSQATFDEWNKATGHKKLPDYVEKPAPQRNEPYITRAIRAAKAKRASK